MRTILGELIVKLKVFGSNSKGNGYAMTDNQGNTILLECGVPVAEVKKYLDFDLSKVMGCLLTHGHQDHCKYVSQYLKSGLDVAMSIETAKMLKIDGHHRVKTIEANRKYTSLMGEFTVLPVEMQHDVHTFGFVINHKECGPTVFITDSYYSKYRFANVCNFIMECNYSEEIMQKKLATGELNAFVRNRVLQSHLSLEHLLQMLAANDLSKTNNIVLVHLSDTNSDEAYFKNKVSEATGKTVHIADSGMEINLDRMPF